MKHKKRKSIIIIIVQPSKKPVSITIRPSGKILVRSEGSSVLPSPKKLPPKRAEDGKEWIHSYSVDNPVITFLRRQKGEVSFKTILDNVKRYKMYVCRVLRWAIKNGYAERTRGGHYIAKT